MSFGYQILGFGAGGPGASEWLEATGGTESTYTDSGVDYKAHVYLSDSTFVVAGLGTDSDGDKVDYYCIGGGGGAVISSSFTTTMTKATHPITIGGAAAAGYDQAAQGSDSVIFVGAPFEATGQGGGGGGTSIGGIYRSGQPGGCGGGAVLSNPIGVGSLGEDGATAPGAGGGGGMGAAGSAINGGNGEINAFDNNSYYYGGAGGSGGGHPAHGAGGGTGGAGGGGGGSWQTTGGPGAASTDAARNLGQSGSPGSGANGGNAGANTGGGGGGGAHPSSHGGVSGTGYAVVRYKVGP